MRLIIFLLLIFSWKIIAAQTQIGNDIDGEAAYDRSGAAVSLSSDGKRVAIGATGNDGSALNAGHVRIYQETAGMWMQIGEDIDGEAAQDESGTSVSLSSDGKRVAIGAYFNDGNGSGSGHVRIYEEVGGAWVQIGEDIDGESGIDNSGWSISLSLDGKRVAIGARFNDDGGLDAGHARIYQEVDGAWTQVGQDIDGEAATDVAGGAVSLSSDGKRVAIGADGNDGSAANAGHVRVYEEIDGVWVQVGEDIDGEATLDSSGASVSLSANGRRVAIGAPLNDDSGLNAGHVRIYEEIGGVWVQIGNDIDGEAAGDMSGTNISLSSDGKRVAIAADENNGNGTESGHIRIYEEINNEWIQLGEDIDGEFAGDRSGWSVALSADGERAAIGAIVNSGGGDEVAGHVRVYGNLAGQPTQTIAAQHEGQNKNIQVFPNPSNGDIRIQISNTSTQRMNVQIIDSTGRKVWESGRIEDQLNWTKELDIEGNGLYFVVTQIGYKTYYKQVVVNTK